jgi:RNA polymerase sigma factor (TIGR02999 family)
MPHPPGDNRGDVTRVLNEMRTGEVSGRPSLVVAIYAELRQMAGAKMALERDSHTLQATDLVHEAWLRLGDGVFESRAHFFAAAAEAMRRILVDRARRRKALKHGAGAEHQNIDDVEIATPLGDDDEVLAVHDALDRLADYDARKAELVKLRYFNGMSSEAAAQVLGISLRTAARDWDFARAWLHREIRKS